MQHSYMQAPPALHGSTKAQIQLHPRPQPRPLCYYTRVEQVPRWRGRASGEGAEGLHLFADSALADPGPQHRGGAYYAM